MSSLSHETTMRVPCIPVSATQCVAVLRMETLMKRARDPRFKSGDPDNEEIMDPAG